MDAEAKHIGPIQEAQKVLSAKGFSQEPSGRWHGMLAADGVRIDGWITIPPEFPYCMPVVRIDCKSLARRIPHVERDGKLCLAPTTGILLDVARPDAIMAECLERAQTLLRNGLRGTNESDLGTEFLAYWESEQEGGTIKSIVTPTGQSREISLIHYHPPITKDRRTLAADDLQAGEAWRSRAVPGATTDEEKAWLHCLTSRIQPPTFDRKMTIREFKQIVRDHSEIADCAAFSAWLTVKRLPCTVLYCMPLDDQGNQVIFAARFKRAVGDNRARALRGFREHTVPVLREFACTSREPLCRMSVDRLDWEFLLPRAGGELRLRHKCVAVVGCGAIGSRIVDKLAEMGVGTIRLVDSENLRCENIHRHALGVEFVGMNKAKAMATAVGKRFPHIHLDVQEGRIQDVIHSDPSYILACDLICVALGDETTELWMNEVIGSKPIRLHAWVEPLGLGGHVLVTGCPDSTGCYHCLFRRGEDGGLKNDSAFAAEGQTFARSMAGCSGTFTPYSAWDADRTASEAARLASQVLSGAQRRNVLLSWFGNPALFMQKGFSLSTRATMFSPGEVKCIDDFADGTCTCAQSNPQH